jgi:hypothetical protein
MATIGLNAVLLWRSAPAFARALGGARPLLVPAHILPEGESNVVPLRPRVRAAAGRPVRQLAA